MKDNRMIAELISEFVAQLEKQLHELNSRITTVLAEPEASEPEAAEPEAAEPEAAEPEAAEPEAAESEAAEPEAAKPEASEPGLERYKAELDRFLDERRTDEAFAKADERERKTQGVGAY